MTALSGKVKFFNEEKGYGFIQPNDGGKDVFVHVSALRDSHLDSLSQDDEVTFDKIEGNNGKFQAENIRITN